VCLSVRLGVVVDVGKGSSPGLSKAEADKRLQQHGPNRWVGHRGGAPLGARMGRARR
jgi:hypothetical protein